MRLKVFFLNMCLVPQFSVKIRISPSLNFWSNLVIQF